MRKLHNQILLAFVLLFATAGATFSQINYKAANASNLAGKWVDLGTNGTAVSMSNYDDASSSSQSIGFTFKFNGTDYTDLIINTNGFIKFGTSAPSANNLFYSTGNGTTGGVFNATGGDSNILAVFNHDLEGSANGAEIRVETSGASGNQVCTIQWKNFKDKTTTPVVQFDNLSFQIKLYEGSNVIEYIYGPFTASANASNFKTVAVGLKGSGTATTDIVSITKPSASAWSTAVIQDGNYTGNTHNVRNTALPDSGRTYRFVPSYNNDVAVTNIYSLGKLPIPFAVPHGLEVRVLNTGTADVNGFTAYLQTTGANTMLDSVVYSNTLTVGSNDILYFMNYAPTNLGIDTIRVIIKDDNNFNNGLLAQNVNPNSYSYVDISQPPSGGVGFNGGTGDFVAKFNSSSANYINQVKVNFQSNNLDYKIGIWDVDTLTGRPNTNLWTSGALKTLNGQAVISVNPPIAVQGSFFVGVRQTGITNVAFAFQFENPIRDSTMYYTAPTGGATWTDFASLGTTNFRFMIEPRLMIPKDAGVIKLVNPGTDTCGGGKVTDMTLQIQNLGTDTIDLSTDSIAVYGVAINPNNDTTTYGPVWVNQGIFYPNDTLDVTVSSNFDMTLMGDYYIWGYTQWSSDNNYQNDTLPRVYRLSSGADAQAVALTGPAICNGDTAILSSASSANAVLYQWLYNGAAISNATDTGYFATVAGDYSCQVTNGYGCTAISDTITVTLKNAPSPNLLYTKTSICLNDSIQITASTNATNYTYEWYFNGSLMTGKTDSVIYASSTGAYQCVVTDGTTGCKGTSSTVNITQGSTPNAAFSTAGNKTAFCQNDSLMLDAGGVSGNTYQWILNGNAINGATGSKYYATAAGTYSVKVTNSGGCFATSSGTAITVNPAPAATVSSNTGKFAVCDQDTLTLSAPSAAGNTYQWSDNNGSISGATAQTLKVTTAGDYAVTVTNSNGCSATSTKVTVTVSQSPSSTIKSPANTQFCEGDSIKLESSTSNAGDTYQWKLNGTNISGATAGNIYAAAGGDYSLVITNAAGCSGESPAQTMVALASPKPIITAKNSTTICEGDSVELQVSTSATTSSLQWKLNGNDITGAGNSNYMAKAAGNYAVYAAGTNGCNGTSAGIAVSVNPLPAAAITYASKTLSANTGAGLTYQWYKDGSPIAGATSATFNPTGNGKYTCEVSDGNGCSKMSNEITVADMGIAIDAYINLVNIFPNPSNGKYTVNLGMNYSGNIRIRTLDIAGRIVTDETINMNKGNNFQQIDLTNFAKGIYMLNIEVNGTNANFKLVKE